MRPILKPGRLSLPARLTLILLLASLPACVRPEPTGTPQPLASCGDGLCGSGETDGNCPQDCPGQPFEDRFELTRILSEGNGEIAVLIASPLEPRYPEGAGVVVVVSPFFGSQIGFQTSPDFTSLGLIQITYLWPGLSDPAWEASSAGEFDYGGEASIQALQDVLRFASGLQPDVSGRYLVALTRATPLMDEIGLYASADAAIAAVNVLSLHSKRLQSVGTLVAYAPDSLDTISALEAGHRDRNGIPVYNPFYTYPGSYSPEQIRLNFANLRWDPGTTSEDSPFTGRPYLDLDSSGDLSAPDHLFADQVPVMFGKRYYSTSLTRALLDNGALSLAVWPGDLATPAEAERDWPFRQTLPSHFYEMNAQNPDLDIKVMLVFGQEDPYQVAIDKPHVHQLFQGFRFIARQWVRLNPDRSYAEQLLQRSALDFPDNPANTQPDDWLEIASFAYPGQGQVNQRMQLAGVAEMADRLHTGRWDENVGQTFYAPAPTPTPEP
jgi:hypothetical protein